MQKLLLILTLLCSIIIAQPSCNLGNITTATRIAPSMFPYTSPTSGITVSATWTCPTLGNTSYTCGATSFACSPTAWWLNGAAQVITLTFSCPVTEFSVVFNGTNSTEEFIFNATTGTISLSDFCATGFAVTGGGNRLLCSSASATGNMVKVNNPTGSTVYTLTHNGLGSGSRISLLDCFTCGPLPFVAGTIAANYDLFSDKTLVTWQSHTPTEDRFLVEHSKDGQQWNTIGSIASVPSGKTESYVFPHPEPGAGQHYYRIRQEDTQGNYLYSEVSALVIEQVPGTFAVFPNPSNGVVCIRTGTAHAMVEVFDLSGARIHHGVISGAGNLDLSHLGSGMYLMKVTREDGASLHTRINIE